MFDKQARFTVIVPTRERPDTLAYSLRTLMAQDYDNLTILVSDNFSQDDTRDVVESLDDRRIRYVNTGRRVGMALNWEFALSHVDAGWVTFLGDDDGLMPDAIRQLNDIVAEFPCEAVSSAHCVYSWPDSGASSMARLFVPTGRSISYLNSRLQLASVMPGKTPYKRLPWLYQGGFATTNIINRARNVGGSFFMSRIPDIYSAIALSNVTDRYLRIEIPLAIAGVSRHSTGISATNSKTQPAPWDMFLSEENIPFHSTLIFGKSVPVAVYECYLQSGFLHHDFLQLDLKDQLELAIAATGKESPEAILDQCSQIAELNGIQLLNNSLTSTWRRAEVNLRRQGERLAGIPFRQILSGEDAAGRNVFEASQRAAHVASLARSRSPIANAFINVVAELSPRSIARHF